MSNYETQLAKLKADNKRLTELNVKLMSELNKCKNDIRWCDGCKEYDNEKHCCHRFSHFIKEVANDNKQYYEDIVKENEILKEGVKALSNYCSYNNEKRNIQEDLAYIEVIFDAECIEEEDDGDYKKIKAMLEVINEQNNR